MGGKAMKHKDNASSASCFGNLDVVFPVDEGGLRKIAMGCFSCTYLKACLKQAMAGEAGLSFKEERIDRAYRHGLIGAFRRWSEKKHIRRRIQEIKKK
jgi:hypothetical protein